MFKIRMKFNGKSKIDEYRKSEVELIESQSFDSFKDLQKYFDVNMAGVFGSGWKIEAVKLVNKK